MNERIEGSLPKTWNRGTGAIDHIYTTIDVSRSIKKAGFAPFNHITLSDHRGIFIDIDMAMLFDEELHQIQPSQFRRLQSSHIKRVTKYNQHFS